MSIHDKIVQKLKAAGNKLTCGNSYIAMAEMIFQQHGFAAPSLDRDTAKKVCRAYVRDDVKTITSLAAGPKTRERHRDLFLQSYEWRRLRMEALKKHGNKCQCCGASPDTGAVMNVDHIKPRKLFPQLALDINNLQVLCGACNHGKGNWDMTDWRSEREPSVSEG